MNRPRIAIFYDWLNQWGGAERLLLDLLKVYPHSHLYTTIYNPSATPWLPKFTPIHTSLINELPFSQNHHRLYSFLQPIAVENFDFSFYDIVISLTSFAGKSIITPPATCHICYCLTPNRHIYNQKYLKFYQPIDRIYAQRPDYYLTTSATVQKRIKKYYHRNSTVIYPGVDLNKFKINNLKLSHNNYFLVVSRLVPYKRLDIAISACQQLNLNLLIVGSGRYLDYLKSISSFNVQFLGSVSENKLISLYQNCQALICPQKEDFGLTALESQACGRPVIAYHRGGIAETVIDGKTGILFSKQTVSSLVLALDKFKLTNFKPHFCHHQASRFSQSSFMLNFNQIVLHLWQQYRLSPSTTIS